MNNRRCRLETLAEIIADYRSGEVAPRTPDLIDEWLQQFPAPIQDQMLKALVHVFRKTYISRDVFKAFLMALASTDKLSPGCEPVDYWKKVNLLDIQQGGNSQKEILKTFDEVLQETHGFGLTDTGSEDGDFVYIDDCIGTGNRVRWDLCAWMKGDIPEQVNLHVITPILYMGSWWIDKKLQETATANGKKISLHKWRLEDFEMENRLGKRNTSDVLWPTAIPNDTDVQAYANHLDSLGHAAVLRNPGNPGASGIFKDDSDRILLEQAFLVRGCQIRRECGNLPDRARPLGYHNLDCFGFGSMFVTYRNCPNNCPLALWVQQAVYPALFPRKTNTQTADENFMKEFI
jgi:hypothetical protein